MDYREALERLEQAGTEQNRKVYARHGVGKKMYGVSFANLKKLRKEIRRDHKLALRLWKSGNHDARILATMVADPTAIDNATLETWVADLDNYVVTDAFSTMVIDTPVARRKAEKWIKSRKEFVGQAGYNVLAQLALKDRELPDAYFAEHIERIEEKIHNSPNRTRHAMNNALISIGMRSSVLEKMSVAAAKRIGKVAVNHGETSCKTPDAVEYIARARAYRESTGTRRRVRK
jgi:3-methyladenine DNA glycosylase AlkD